MKMKHVVLAITFGVLASFQVTAIAAAPQFLADRHVSRGIGCPMCHDDVQKGTVKVGPNKYQVCTQCHGWYDKVSQRTVPKDPEDMNPHSQHDGNLPCTECHKGHKAGVNYCGGCHMWNFKVP